MENIFTTTLIGLFFGTFGTTLGGIIGITFNKTSNKFLSFILSLASGLMISVVCFDLIPEAMQITNIGSVIIATIVGVFAMIFCDVFVQEKLNYKKGKTALNSDNGRLLKTGIIVSIGLALHNIPEGLAIGAGFDASFRLGFSLAIAIALHDVPEGVSMALPMKKGGVSKLAILGCVFLSGVATGVGALVGAIIGEISEQVIAFCLAFAAGAMLYVVSGELIPESNKLYSGRMSSIGNIIGFIIGIISSVV